MAIALVTFVLPKIATLLQDLGTELPLITRVIIGASDFLTTWWWLLVLLICAGLVTLRSVSRTERGRYALDGLKLRAPYFGKLARTVAIARWARTLALVASVTALCTYLPFGEVSHSGVGLSVALAAVGFWGAALGLAYFGDPRPYFSK